MKSSVGPANEKAKGQQLPRTPQMATRVEAGENSWSKEKIALVAAVGVGTVALVAGLVYHFRKPKAATKTVPLPSSRDLRIPEVTIQQPTRKPRADSNNLSRAEELKPQQEQIVVSEEVSEDSDECSRQTLIDMFKVILHGMETTINKLATREARLREEQPDLPDQDILELLNKEYLDEILQVQQDAFKRFNTTEEKASLAVNKWQDDPEFNAVLEKMNRIRQILEGGQVDEEQIKKIPATLTVTRVTELFTEMIDAMIAAREECFRELVVESGQAPTTQALEERYRERVHEVKEHTLKKFEVEDEILDVAMLAYGQDKDLNQQMLKLQKRQREAFEELCSRCSDVQKLDD